MFDINKIRKDFPILKRKINGKKLVYFDSAATSQKPSSVINFEKYFYENNNSNINRGVHTLGDEATTLFEDSRKKVAGFINANNKEIVFAKNATECINLVAYSLVRPLLKNGDVILLTEMEHHANIIPWQIIAKDVGAVIEYVPVTSNGLLDYTIAEKLLAKKPKFFSFSHVSNVLGTVNNAKELCTLAHSFSVPVLVDAAQSVAHMKIDVKNIDCDFLVFSAHKMLGPTGVGVLYGKSELLNFASPFLGGGDMVREAYFDRFVSNDIPHKFEAGTPNIAGVVAFSKSIDYLENIGMKNVKEYDHDLVSFALKSLSKISNIKIYGPSDSRLRSALISFNVYTDNGLLIHPHDISTILDSNGIAIRAGHHCCMPLHVKLGLSASCRISFNIYNTKDEISFFVKKLNAIAKMFSGGKK